ncbi:MAG: YafY family protein [Planctomycetota bacterium]
MRRADRLFQVIQLLRARCTVTAAELADELEVSERTVYRDVHDLVACGVPIEGEAGVGYVLDRSFDLPPLMFTGGELQALALGASMVAAFADPELAREARGALGKVEAALPAELRVHLERPVANAMRFTPVEGADRLPGLRRAIVGRRRVAFGYTDADGRVTDLTARPLAVHFWGATWTLTAWCELREDFRHFRLDRIEDLDCDGASFEDEPGRTLDAFLACMEGHE